MAGRQCGRTERTTEGDLGARMPEVPHLKSRRLHQMMSELPTRFLVGFTDFDSCSNLTDLYAFSGSEGNAYNHGVRLPRFQSWLYR